jgi:glycosyltransferase involved in cell wall biosynthesis
MGIVYVTDNYLPFVGGVETHVRQMAQALTCTHKVRIVAHNFSPNSLPEWAKVLNANLLAPTASFFSPDGEVCVFSVAPRSIDRLLLLPLLLRTTPKLRRWLYHEINKLTHGVYHNVVGPKLRRIFAGADVVHSMAFGDLGWSAQRIARELGIPFVCTPFVHPGQWGDGPYDVAFLKECDAVIGLVESDADYLESLGVSRGNLHVIGVSPDLPPVADGAAFRERHGIGNRPMVLYVGRMMRQKGAPDLVAAARRLLNERPEVQFIFIGPANQSEQRIFENAPPQVRYLGKVSAQEKADALHACDIFCMPSTSEILPTVYLEAWNYGKPVIGGTAHGLDALVSSNGAGVNVPQDAARLAAAISDYIDKPELRQSHGRKGQDLVADQYSVAAVAGKLEALYSQTISASKVLMICRKP